MVIQRILLSTTRSLMLNTGRQLRDSDSHINNCREKLAFDCCEIDDQKHLRVTFLLGEGGRRRRVCASEGETIDQIAKRNHISLADAERVEAFLHSDLRPVLVDDHFYSNLRGPGHVCLNEHYLSAVPELSCPVAIRRRALSKDRHDGLHIALL